MSACEDCLRASVLRSEGLVHAETTCASTIDAARLLRMDPPAMLERLRREKPGIEAELARAVSAIGAGSSDGGWTICRHEAGFPSRLLCFGDARDIPAVLYGVGAREILENCVDQASVAIVGARRASAYGREVAYTLGREAAASGLTVISGMALGVDGAAHRGALQAGGRTIAVLAGAPEIPYPRSHRLLHEQLRSDGCVVSENPPGSQARRWAFVARNRLIAGLAAMTVFVEGAEDSGARHTVGFAEELGTLVGAVPGPVTGPLSAGPNGLLAASSAAVVRGVEDVLDELGFESGQPRLERSARLERFDCAESGDGGQEPLAHLVLELIAAGDRDPRTICSSLPEHGGRAVTQTLGKLELQGRISRLQSGEYQLVGRP